MIANRYLFMVLVALLAVVFSGCGAPGGMAAKESLAEKNLYTRYNIHVQDQVRRNGDHVYQASYANYTDPGSGHLIIPAGSQIRMTRITSREFAFFVPEKNLEVLFEYHEPRMGMSVNQYLEKITSPTPVSTAGLSELDRKGIAQGKALVGMSREGVMTALGYPAAHRTPSLDAETYVYWTNRFGTSAISFDDQGKVKKIAD